MLRIRGGVAAVCVSLVSMASVTGPARAQSIPDGASEMRPTTPLSFTGGHPCGYAFTTLNGVQNGTTTIPFQSCADAATGWAIPFVGATLTGGTVSNGHINSTTPITFNFSDIPGTQRPGGFGADFRVFSGTDVIFLQFLLGGEVLHSSYGAVGSTPQFLAQRVGGPRADQVRISTLGGSLFLVDNLYVVAPEPATWCLFGTGLLVLGGLARRRVRSN